MKHKLWSGAVLAAALGIAAAAQTGLTPRNEAPQAGESGSGSGAAQRVPLTTAPTAPAPGASAATKVVFPPTNPKLFTASSPTVETVNSFLHAIWGFDENRVWSVAAIETTNAPGIVEVRVLVGQKNQPSRLAQTTLFVTPDGKHAIAGDLVPFGAHPFADTAALLAAGATGPVQGAAGKQLELVAFTDPTCAACKTAQGTLDQLREQFPQAHIVLEDLPLEAGHPFAYRTAAVGVCVRQSKGDQGYLAYAAAVMAAQADFSKDKLDTTLGAAAKAAGADPTAALACADTPATRAAVDAVVQLAQQAGVKDVPLLFANGRPLPLAQVPASTLARIIGFQGTLDGVDVHQQPALSTLR